MVPFFCQTFKLLYYILILSLIVQILFFLSAVLLILNIFDLPDNSVKKSSAFYENTSELLPLTIDYLSNYTPDSKQIIEDYINEKDTVK